MRNKGAGPFGREVSIDEIQRGDLIQLAVSKPDFQHTPVITKISSPDADGILIAAHSFDSIGRPLSSYNFRKIRFIHIDGFRRN